jgi:hypothetical protein
MSTGMMTLIAAVILAALVIVPLIIAFTPSRHRDPQDGMAIGFLMLFSVTMLLPGGLLAWAHFAGHPGVVRVIFWLLMAVMAYVAVAWTADTLIRRRKQRQ